MTTLCLQQCFSSFDCLLPERAVPHSISHQQTGIRPPPCSPVPSSQSPVVYTQPQPHRILSHTITELRSWSCVCSDFFKNILKNILNLNAINIISEYLTDIQDQLPSILTNILSDMEMSICPRPLNENRTSADQKISSSTKNFFSTFSSGDYLTYHPDEKYYTSNRCSECITVHEYFNRHIILLAEKTSWSTMVLAISYLLKLDFLMSQRNIENCLNSQTFLYILHMCIRLATKMNDDYFVGNYDMKIIGCLEGLCIEQYNLMESRFCELFQYDFSIDDKLYEYILRYNELITKKENGEELLEDPFPNDLHLTLFPCIGENSKRENPNVNKNIMREIIAKGQVMSLMNRRKNMTD
jgi:hypothetical protein